MGERRAQPSLRKKGVPEGNVYVGGREAGGGERMEEIGGAGPGLTNG